MQIVLSNNRVIAHGGNYMAFDGVVINTETGERYERATVAECDNCPSDIDTVGYEYHAGTFVPCAPYGIGDGNVVVACNKDCKALKDSGVPFGRMAQIVTKQYTGNGDGLLTLEFGAVPVILFFRGVKKNLTGGKDIDTDTIVFDPRDEDMRWDRPFLKLYARGSDDIAPGNLNGYEYIVTAILQGGE